MGRKSINNPQNYDEMVSFNKETKASSKLYKIENAEFIDEQLSTMINSMGSELITSEVKEKISLGDVRKVKNQTIIYIGNCVHTATLPSIAGLARALGTTRQAIYEYIKYGTNTEAAAWLEQCKDLFSDMLSNAALRGCCNPVVAIFLQKAQFGLRETSTLEIAPVKTEGPLGRKPTLEELEAAINALPDDD